MLSLGTFTRSAPRIVARCKFAAPKSTALFGVRSSRFIPRYASPFSTLPVRWQGNEELLAKLKSEYEVESSSKEEEDANAELRQVINDFLAHSPFKVEDVPGNEEVKLTRTFNDEHITISFSIADMNAEQEQYDEDRALYDESEEGDSNAKRGQEANEEEPENSQPTFTVRLSIRVTRQAKSGAILIEATAEEGTFAIENVFYFPDSTQAEAETAELHYKRRNVYAGPPFAQLDEDLQALFERYLEDRGVNARMAEFIPEYVDFKEQQEYLAWLKNVTGFLE